MSKPHPSGAAAEDQTGRFVIQPNGRPRPLSPHLQIWRWHVTMTASILFRVTIGAASVGAILITAWLGAVAFGPDAHAAATEVLRSPPGLVIGFGLTVVLFSFFLNGARHTLNDTGNGLTPKTSDVLSWIAVIGPVVLAAAFWALLMGVSA
ncbi:MAG: succinate dehydrogenase, cytochrome b556 subunit [Alphaproteobacteria bacterium]|nr:succinate dehydrogenase, cytochrome b556 subunit [Alphaproteobacteria bacterium]MBU1526471.1 succinate dehydrogenase, cytochrome b556 subunit [Alphaproteobacteria bacterium]MBU2116736.1 succinate dehydrogenase, cytochrome b556 subunit [Alphaproteobacteria bacterium]MBU2350311.1 succinate dehydrogenase, cytochrome b556 subunit [Alphaproteobacteria bacterium]MBU2382523.1 succinate dehydrogenase, cytochrome b556 subunit [Alphaproteobacteria bacterium]